MILKTEHYPERGIMYHVKLNPASQPAHPCAGNACSPEFRPTSCLRGVNTDGTKANHAKVRFDHSVDVARAVNEGYIEVDGIRLELSDEAKKQLEESRKKVQEENDNRTLIEIEQQNAESAKKQGEAMGKEMENMAKAIEIFRRMSKGGMVPGKDEKLLMEFDDKMYQTAKSMQLMAERHKKHKRLSEDPEEEEDESLERKPGPRQATEMDVEIEGDSAEVTGVSEVEVDPEG